MDHRENGSPQVAGKTAQILVEFLEVAITSIVFLKGLYPSSKGTPIVELNYQDVALMTNSRRVLAGAFERSRYLNLVVHRARHPQLRDYIHSTVLGLSHFIEKGLVERVAVIFSYSDDIPLERFIFKLTTVNQSCGSDVEDANLECSLRSFLIKLAVSESLTKAISQDCKWEIMAYFRSLPEHGMSKEASLWMPTDTARQWQQPPIITPIKSMSSVLLSLQLYLEHPTLSESLNENFCRAWIN